MSSRQAHRSERPEQASGRPRRCDEAARVHDLLREEIVCGRYGPQSLLPGERELGLEYAVGRNVIRDALTLLRNDGLVDRVQGSGTFVLSSKALHRFDRVHAINDSAQRARRVTGDVLTMTTIIAPRPVAELLRLTPGAECAVIEYTAAIGTTPFSVSTSYLPLEIGARIDRTAFTGDFYQLLETAGFAVGGGDLSVEAVAADARSAAIVHVSPGSPLMLFHRRLNSTDGSPLEVGFVRCRGDQLTLQIQLPRTAKGEIS